MWSGVAYCPSAITAPPSRPIACFPSGSRASIGPGHAPTSWRPATRSQDARIDVRPACRPVRPAAKMGGGQPLGPHGRKSEWIARTSVSRQVGACRLPDGPHRISSCLAAACPRLKGPHSPLGRGAMHQHRPKLHYWQSLTSRQALDLNARPSLPLVPAFAIRYLLLLAPLPISLVVGLRLVCTAGSGSAGFAPRDCWWWCPTCPPPS